MRLVLWSWEKCFTGPAEKLLAGIHWSGEVGGLWSSTLAWHQRTIICREIGLAKSGVTSHVRTKKARGGFGLKEVGGG